MPYLGFPKIRSRHSTENVLHGVLRVARSLPEGQGREESGPSLSADPRMRNLMRAVQRRGWKRLQRGLRKGLTIPLARVDN